MKRARKKQSEAQEAREKQLREENEARLKKQRAEQEAREKKLREENDARIKRQQQIQNELRKAATVAASYSSGGCGGGGGFGGGYGGSYSSRSSSSRPRSSYGATSSSTGRARTNYVSGYTTSKGTHTCQGVLQIINFPHGHDDDGLLQVARQHNQMTRLLDANTFCSTSRFHCRAWAIVQK